MDIARDADEAPIGNQYMSSMAKFITAWMRACGRWRPYRWHDWMLCTTNQTMRMPKMISHTALGPKAHRPTNMPAMATPMKRWEISTSRPAGRSVATDRINRVRQ